MINYGESLGPFVVFTSASCVITYITVCIVAAGRWGGLTLQNALVLSSSLFWAVFETWVLDMMSSNWDTSKGVWELKQSIQDSAGFRRMALVGRILLWVNMFLLTRQAVQGWRVELFKLEAPPTVRREGVHEALGAYPWQSTQSAGFELALDDLEALGRPILDAPQTGAGVAPAGVHDSDEDSLQGENTTQDRAVSSFEETSTPSILGPAAMDTGISFHTTGSVTLSFGGAPTDTHPRGAHMFSPRTQWALLTLANLLIALLVLFDTALHGYLYFTTRMGKHAAVWAQRGNLITTIFMFSLIGAILGIYLAFAGPPRAGETRSLGFLKENAVLVVVFAFSYLMGMTLNIAALAVRYALRRWLVLIYVSLEFLSVALGYKLVREVEAHNYRAQSKTVLGRSLSQIH